MTQLIVSLPDKDYKNLLAAASSRGESTDTLIKKCLNFAGVISASTSQPMDMRHWPAGFFERTAGCFAEEPLVRAPQGEYEKRYELL